MTGMERPYEKISAKRVKWEKLAEITRRLCKEKRPMSSWKFWTLIGHNESDFDNIVQPSTRTMVSLPEFLFDTYKRYKADTNRVAE